VDLSRDVATNLGGSREGNKWKSWIIDDSLTNVRSITAANGEDILESVFLKNTSDDLCSRNGGKASSQCWLPDDLISGDQGDGCVPTAYSDWEVEGGDYTNYAEWIPVLHHEMVWPFTWNNFASNGSGHTKSHVANINELLNLTLSLRLDLAHLE